MLRSEKKIKVVSKTEQVLNYVRERIESEELLPGDQILPENKLCEHLGVSMITVRRGLQKLADEGVICKVKGKGNFVSGSVGRKNDAGNKVNLLLPVKGESEQSDAFLGPFIQGLNSVLLNNALQLQIVQIEQGSLVEFLAKKSNRNVIESGLVTVNYNLSDDEVEELSRFDIATVEVGCPGSKSKVKCVGIDHYKSGRNLAEHFLLEHGLKRTLYITRDMKQRPHIYDVIDGMKSVYSDEGLDSYEFLQYFSIPENLSPTDIYEHLCEYKRLFAVNEVVVFHGEELALPLVKLLQELNISFPGDICLMAYDNFSIIAEYNSPSITAVSFSPEELGIHAADIFMRIKKQQSVSDAELALQSKLIVRESCGCHID